MFKPRLPRPLGRLCLARAAFARPPRYHVHRAPGTVQASRYMATPPPQLANNDQLSAEQYHKLADDAMDTLVEQLEQLLDESEHQEYELDYSSGVLTLKLGVHGTYVINKQPPNKQIWLSSPLSGPKRYDYSLPDETWQYSRDNTLLIDLLNEELSSAFDKALNMSLSSN